MKGKYRLSSDNVFANCHLLWQLLVTINSSITAIVCLLAAFNCLITITLFLSITINYLMTMILFLPVQTVHHFLILRTYPPMKMERPECSETLEYKIRTPGNNPEESIQPFISYFFSAWKENHFFYEYENLFVHPALPLDNSRCIRVFLVGRFTLNLTFWTCNK